MAGDIGRGATTDDVEFDDEELDEEEPDGCAGLLLLFEHATAAARHEVTTSERTDTTFTSHLKDENTVMPGEGRAGRRPPIHTSDE